MDRYGYLLMILFTVFGSFWLEIVLKTRVLVRLRRALIAILPISTIFLIWDFYAVSRDHWDFDARQTLGINGPLEIPLEEFLFFLVVPLAAILTLEAVRNVKKKWVVGDEVGQ
jgi:lycopene cyclase domain-containing protein